MHEDGARRSRSQARTRWCSNSRSVSWSARADALCSLRSRGFLSLSLALSFPLRLRYLVSNIAAGLDFDHSPRLKKYEASLIKTILKRNRHDIFFIKFFCTNETGLCRLKPEASEKRYFRLDKLDMLKNTFSLPLFSLSPIRSLFFLLDVTSFSLLLLFLLSAPVLLLSVEKRVSSHGIR